MTTSCSADVLLRLSLVRESTDDFLLDVRVFLLGAGGDTLDCTSTREMEMTGTEDIQTVCDTVEELT